MKTFKPHTLCGPVLLVAAWAGYGQVTGSVAGTVLENGSRPMAGATVSYIVEGHYEPDSRRRLRYVRPPIGGNVLSGADGTFTIGGVPPGRYMICAGGTLPIHVRSCGWTNNTPTFPVAAGKVTAGLRLNVSRGALLDITIDDPSGCAGRNTRASVYLFANSTSVPARLVSSASAMLHYQAVVPQQVALRLTTNHSCSFSDSGGSALTMRGTGLTIPAIRGKNGVATLTAR